MIRTFVESWTSTWTLVLGLGYIGRMLAWPALGRLGAEATVNLMMFASLAAVLALCIAGYAPAALSVSGWAIGLNLLRRIVTSPE
jgi:hypothetical protein